MIERQGDVVKGDELESFFSQCWSSEDEFSSDDEMEDTERSQLSPSVDPATISLGGTDCRLWVPRRVVCTIRRRERWSRRGCDSQ